MFQFNRSQQNHFCTSMLQLFLMKVGRNASTCCQHPQFLIESVDHRLVTISRFMLTLILQTASNLRLAAIISLQYAYLDQGGGTLAFGLLKVRRGPCLGVSSFPVVNTIPTTLKFSPWECRQYFDFSYFLARKRIPKVVCTTHISLSHAIHVTGFSRNPLTTVLYDIYSQNVNKC